MVTRHMMIDLESLGAEKDSVILSGGIVLFDLEKDTYQEYYQEYDVLSQIAEGRSVSPETVAWWRKTNPKELIRLLQNGSGKLSLLSDVANVLYKEANCKSVFQRGSFDMKVMEGLGFEVPFWSVMDCRCFDVLKRMPKLNSHNALEDCKAQILHVQDVYNKFNLGVTK